MLALIAMGYTNSARAFPLSTQDTGTVGHAKSKVELIIEREEDRTATERETTTVTEFELTHGLRDNLDLSFTQPYRVFHLDSGSNGQTRHSGVGDSKLSFKWRYYQHDNLSLGIKARVTFPTGDVDRELGKGKSTRLVNFILSYKPAPWEFHLDAGYTDNRNSRNQRDNLWHLSAGIGRRLNEDWKVMADIGMDRNKSPGNNDHPHFATVGFSVRLRTDLKFEFGAKFGLNTVATDATWLAGITQRF